MLVINNEGQKVMVSMACYSELQSSFREGYAAVLVNDLMGLPHMIDLESNFQYSA